MPDVAEIAGRLSEAQREMLLAWGRAGETRQFTDEDILPLLTNAPRLVGVNLTETGLAVRAYLENSRD